MTGLARRLDRQARAWPTATETPPYLRAVEHEAEHQTPLGLALVRTINVRLQRRHRHEQGTAAPRAEADPAAFGVLAEREWAELRARLGSGDEMTVLAAWLDETTGWPPLAGWPADARAAFAAELAWAERYLRDLRTCPALAPWRARTGWTPARDEEADRATAAVRRALGMDADDGGTT
jgi:hypothetical protein